MEDEFDFWTILPESEDRVYAYFFKNDRIFLVGKSMPDGRLVHLKMNSGVTFNEYMEPPIRCAYYSKNGNLHTNF